MPSLDTNLTAKAVALKAQHPDWGYLAIAREIGWDRHHVRRAIEHAERGAGKNGLPAPIVAEIEPRTAQEFAQRINACWRESAAGIIKTGEWLIRAKAALAHGEFGAMIEGYLTFGASTAQRLMAIAENPQLTNPAHVQYLPPHWGTLYAIGRLNPVEISTRIADGTIHAGMERRDVSTIHKARRVQVQHSLSDETSKLAASGRKFPVIYADPATRFLAGQSPKSAENHYRTMSMDELCGMGEAVQSRCLPNCQAFIWTTVPQLANTITRILPAWGFSYSSSCVWDKTDADHESEMGPGLVFRNQHEILIYCLRGRPPGPVVKPLSVYRERKREHSRKPDYYRSMIAQMTGDLPVLEMFARIDAEHPLPEGWESWGNESLPPHDPDTGEIAA